MPGPIIADQVRTWLGIDGTAEADTLEPVVAAVNSQLTAWKGDPAAWPEHIVHGAVQLAARVHRRRGSAGGVDQFGELVAYQMRNDPETAQLLEIGPFEPPKVG